MLFSKTSTVIRDGTKLSFDYVPVELAHRTKQMENLSMLFRPVIESGASETAFLTGNIGTGKTVTAKRFCADMSQYCAKNGIPMDYVLVNCRQKSNESAIVQQIVSHFDPGYPERGFSPSEMLRTVRAILEKTGKRFVIILDEVDVLLKKEGVDLVYQLSRFNDGITKRVSLSLIMISQEYVMDRLDGASRSSFKVSNTIRFNKYTAEELRTIIGMRAAEALITGSYNEDALDLIADISAEFGDARFAIDVLDKSARSAENRPEGLLTAEDVRAAKAMIYSVVTEYKLEALDDNHLATLLAIARSIKSMSYVPLPITEKTYAIVCEEYGIPARKHTQFWTYIQDLEKQNLIVTSKRVVEDQTYGTTLCISLPDIPSKVLAGKLERLLE